MEKENQKRETWVGYRPSVISTKKKNKKHDRKEGKQICRNAMKGGKGIMFSYNKFTLTQFLAYLERFHKGYSIALLPNGKTRVLYNSWYYYFDHNNIFWYKAPKEDV